MRGPTDDGTEAPTPTEVFPSFIHAVRTKAVQSLELSREMNIESEEGKTKFSQDLHEDRSA